MSELSSEEDYILIPKPKLGKDAVEINVCQDEVIIVLLVDTGGIILLTKGDTYITDRPLITSIQKINFDSKSDRDNWIVETLTPLFK